jgi:hypothetical protein
MRRYCHLSVAILLGMAHGAHTEETKSESAPKATSAKQKEAGGKGCLTRNGDYGGMPCACLQYRILDFPGPNDLYYCHAHWSDNCEDPYEEDVWCGYPTNPNLPQVCHGANESGECEQIIFFFRRGPHETCPGHGSNLTADNAWDIVLLGLNAAKEKAAKFEFASAPEYFIIPKSNVPKSLGATADVVVMAVEITPQVENNRIPDDSKFTFCLQLDSLDGAKITPITITDSKHSFGRKFRIRYKVAGKDEKRLGLVWMK